MQIGLDKLVQYQGSMQPHNSYVAGNAFEALVGAVYLDRGYNACRRFVERRILEHLIDIDKIAYQEVNFKSRLLEWTQKHRLTLEYELLSEDRDDTGSPVFRTRAVISGIECGRGTGYSKKESHGQPQRTQSYQERQETACYIDAEEKKGSIEMSLTSIIRPFFNPRLKQLDLYSTRAQELQLRVLKHLLTKASDTEWGHAHGYSERMSYSEFAANTPVSSYEELKGFIDRMRHGERDILWPGRVKFYAKSSGTTSDKSKFIPVSHDGLHDTHYAGGRDAVVWYLQPATQSGG